MSGTLPLALAAATSWRAAALLIAVLALVLASVAARRTGRVKWRLAGAGLALGIAALVILVSTR